MSGAGPARAGTWLRRRGRVRHARVRLVCFPHAGGNAGFFYPWAEFLPPDVELVAVQYPGRHDRFSEALVEDMDDLLRGLMPELTELVHEQATTVLLGHSMGALVAYEAARRLPVAPALLVVSARPAPHVDCRTGETVVDDAAMIARLERLGGLAPDSLANPELRELVMSPLRADYRLLESCAPRAAERLEVDILAVVGDQDPEVGVDDVATWRETTAREFTLKVLSGDHFAIGRHAATVVDAVLERIAAKAARE